MDTDDTTLALVEFARAAKFESLTPGCVHAVVRNYLDSVGCAAAGFSGDSPQITRNLAATTSGEPSASAFGIEHKPLLEFAILANAAATRFQDWNDAGLRSGHPSDMGPAIAAVAESSNASGEELISALYAAYQTIYAFGKLIDVQEQGWDQGFYDSLGVAVALGNLLHLSEEQLAHAIALAITPSIPLWVTRFGHISHWKSLASGFATVTATFAVRLAQAGIEGPSHVFDGKGGVFEKVTGPLKIEDIAARAGEPSVPEMMSHKPFPCFHAAQGPIDLMLDMRKQFTVEQVESVRLITYSFGGFVGAGGKGDGEDKRNPLTREAADHSVFYLMARALVDGSVSPDTYSTDKITDPALRPLMQKFSLVEDQGFALTGVTDPDRPSYNAIEVTLKDGRFLKGELTDPRGSLKNPMTDDELTAKFDGSVEKVLSASQHDELRGRLWNLPDERDFHGIATLYRAFATRS